LATLVLSTVGTALGGPVGSAIGALIGQSIDQEVLAPVRRGPRVGDLAVQTSSYGTQIPRIYGTMRVAGSVVWSTDLIEHENADGAKGQPDVTYSYTVSLAVALSSRSAKSVKRIWADGKLLRGAAGDLKVNTTFRFHDGNEDQEIDPLIGSVEGIANTPAYRGLALVVFENLELAEYGNRIPFLSFEIEADDGPPKLGSVLVDASAGAIACDAARPLMGFAAYGRSIKSAVEPLVDSFGVELFDDGTVVRSVGNDAPLNVSREELGNSADAEAAPQLHREQFPIRSVPAALRLTYYDPDRDYQTGEARAVASEQPGNETQQELPVVFSAADAKSLAQDVLARAWAQRDKLTVHLPPARLALQPGTTLELPLRPARWTIEKKIVDGFVITAELRPSVSGGAEVAGDAGRIVGNGDVEMGPVSVALFDLPNILGLSAIAPAVLLAASTATSGWKRRPVQIEFGGQIVAAETSRTKGLLGHSVTALADAQPHLIDDQHSVEVLLLDAEQWLTSCDDQALAAGENLAVLGTELIQFGQAIPLGEGRFRLSHLLRGRGGTEWANAGHGAGEAFCLIQAAALQPIVLPAWTLGSEITAQVSGGTAATIMFTAETLRPPSPVNVVADRQANGDIIVSWTRRSRQGFAWLDYVDAPLGEAREQYAIEIRGSAATIELESAAPNLTVSAVILSGVGAGPTTIQVRQIGDLAASHAAETIIIL
jgi:hypothetical protein